MSANRNSMERAWAAGRRILAVVGFAVVLSAAAIVSVILVHGLGIFEGVGF